MDPVGDNGADASENSSSKIPVRLREPCEIDSASCFKVHHVFGFSSVKRRNIHLLQDGFVLTTSAAAAKIIDVNKDDSSAELVFSPDEKGVGCVCVHPNKKFFAIGGKGDWPNVYVFSFPDRKLRAVLRGGTEREFASMNFNTAGDKLATVGGSPDFLLTVWDWTQERIILRNKAFAQEVYNVSFAPTNDGILTTSGLGHIRFWKMASTFTGIKLQGDIGKFGKVELSDIAAYAEMPDGKVLSGSESGSLLLWDGNFIKLEIRLPDGALPHQGEINVCQLVHADKPSIAEFITAGNDGWVKWWPMSAIDAAETTDENPYLVMSPSRQVFLDGIVPVSIAMDSENGYCLVQDRNGKILRIEEPLVADSQRQVLVSGHSGKAAALAISHADNVAVTGGADGSVRLWDFEKRRELSSLQFSAGASCATWAPKELDAPARIVVVGYADGTLRTLVRVGDAGEELKLAGVVKPHSCKCTQVAFSPDNSILAVGGADGAVFFLAVKNDPSSVFTFKPLGFVHTGSFVNAIAWKGTPQDMRILVAGQKGRVVEINVPQESKALAWPDTRTTFELTGLAVREFFFKRRAPKVKLREVPEFMPLADGESELQPVSKELRQEIEAENAAYIEERDRIAGLPVGDVVAIAWADGSDHSFTISLNGNDAGPIFVCSFEHEYPLETYSNLPNDDGVTAADEAAFAAAKPGLLIGTNFVAGTGAFPPCVSLSWSQSKRFLLNGGGDGSLRVRSVAAPQAYTLVGAHDGRSGAVTCAGFSHDDRFVLSTGADGALIAHRVNADMMEAALKDHAKKSANRLKAKKLWEAHLVQASKGDGKKRTVDPEDSALAQFLRAPVESLSDVEAAKLGLSGTMSVVPPIAVARALHIEQVVDITDSAVYSMQDDKLNTEQNTKEELAEIEKNKVRKVIEKLRGDFEQLFRLNEKDSNETKLQRNEFIIDQELLASLVVDGRNQMEEVVKETQYDVNVSKVRLDKIQKFFLDDLIVESIELRAFSRSCSVSSFRTKKFGKQLAQALDDLRRMLESSAHGGRDGQAGARDPASSGGKDGSSIPTGANAGARGESGADGSNDKRGSGSPSPQEKKKQPGGGWETRKQGRRQRKVALQQLLDTKPDQNSDDPMDVAAIRWVMNNMGDYKLKSAEDYQVPADKQVNAEKKRRQLLLLSKSIQDLRMSFNQKFLALRELKRRVVESARADKARIDEICNRLVLPNEDASAFPLQIDVSEWPEKRLEFTAEELDIFTNGRGTASAPKGAGDTTSKTDRVPSKARAREEDVPAVDSTGQLVRFQNAVLQKVTKDSTTRFEKEEWDICRKRLLFEKTQLLERNASAVLAFDTAVYELRQERSDLQVELAAAELRQILLQRELTLLNDFEKRDAALTKKMETTQAAKSEVVTEISGCQEKLAAKRAEIEVWQEKEKSIVEEFTSAVGGENHPLYSQLLKIFKKKIKRARTGGEEEEDDDSDDEADDEYDDEEEDMEEGEPEEERCPDGCDPAVYDKVLELREKRLDQEEVLSEFNKAVDDLKKACDRHIGREKQIDKELRGTAVEIQSFQNEKQRKLNEFYVYFTAKLSQIACLVEPGEDEPVQGKGAKGKRASVSVAGTSENSQYDPEAPWVTDHDVDEDDPVIPKLKSELEIVLAGIDAPEEDDAVDNEEILESDDNIIARQQALIGKMQQLKREISRLRHAAVAMRERAARLMLPATIDSALVFDREDLKTLHGGIAKLVSENREKKTEFKDLHLTQKKLARESVQKKQEIAALEAKCRDLQMLKFGQLIDLDMIDKMGTSKQAAEIAAKAADLEKANRLECELIQKETLSAKDRLLEATKTNSSLLQEIAKLTEQHRKLEGELNNASSGGAAASIQSHREVQELSKLTRLVEMQGAEITSLKAEINMLRGSNLTKPNQNQVISE